MKSVVETLMVSLITILVTNFKGRFHEILAAVGDKINDKIEATGTQLDDIAKAELVDAFKTAFLPQLEVEGVDGPVSDGV